MLLEQLAVVNTGFCRTVISFQASKGGYFESSTGLVKFGTRYYNPNLGRWAQQASFISRQSGRRVSWSGWKRFSSPWECCRI